MSYDHECTAHDLDCMICTFDFERRMGNLGLCLLQAGYCEAIGRAEYEAGYRQAGIDQKQLGQGTWFRGRWRRP